MVMFEYRYRLTSQLRHDHIETAHYYTVKYLVMLYLERSVIMEVTESE